MDKLMLELFDASTEKTYKILVDPVYERALMDDEFATDLLMKASGCLPSKIGEDKVESEVEPPSTDQNTEDVTEALILAVSSKPNLFDFRIPLKNRSKQITEKLWNEVFNEINFAIPLKDLPSKFKNLRDRYITLRQDILKKPASGSSGASKKPKWKYYDLLSFLGDTLACPISKKSTVVPAPASNDNTIVEQPATPSVSCVGIEEPTASTSWTPKKRVKRQEGNTAFEESVIAGLNKNECSTDHFCKGIAELLKTLDAKTNMKLHINIMQLIMAEKFKDGN